jgi:hypothetical protein
MTHTKDEFDIRGMLAAKLTCWHRLRETEENELVALVAGLTQPAPVQPVGVTTGCALHEGFFTVVFRSQQSIPDGTDLYTTPPTAQQEPVEQALDKMAENARELGLDYEPVQKPVALHAMTKRRIFDAIRGAYDLGYNDARGARAVHGDSAPGYKGRDVEADHGGALISALERYTTQPAPAQPAQQEVTVPDLTHDAWDEWQDKHSLILEREALDDLRSMLAAAQSIPCTWTQSRDPSMPDTYNATCGVVWTFNDGGPAENGMRFCPGCGSKVTKGGSA